MERFLKSTSIYDLSLIRSLITFLIIAFTAISCSQTTDPGLQIIEIPKSSDSELYLSDLAKSVEQIQLETKEGSFIGAILELQQNNEKLYVRDVGDKVLVFDRKGNFLRTLGTLGEGPGEYRSAYSLAIDKKSGKIYLGSFNKLLVYSSEHEFLSEKKFSFFVDYLSIVNEAPVIITDRSLIPVENGYETQSILFQLDQSLNIKDSLLLRNAFVKKQLLMGFTDRHFISITSEETFLYKPVLTPENFLRDTLYQLSEANLTPAFKLEFGQPHFDDKGEKIVKIYNIMNAFSYVICQYTRGKYKMLFIYDKINEKGFNLKDGILDQDGNPVVLHPLDLENNIFYYTKSSEFVNGDTEELNPMIGIVKLK
ncbi:6-bladed beta-propeller [uncultured Algoriphagus sp.]|uniref:6-bladed beta-propeller n=1 Tax=uncultured Algoriphagus sp. TaxID=417365 RepID=UPI0030EEB17E|tara:strand:+ start:721 stop:1824 length:1104 start_codon:yes stop_codon:yes gene_type:complete